jgi:uncharacterized Zn finger protein (UPF0148 family)
MADVDHCVCCGSPIPEGRQVCPICEKNTNKHRKIDGYKSIPFIIKSKCYEYMNKIGGHYGNNQR